jgi:hypothetical protein
MRSAEYNGIIPVPVLPDTKRDLKTAARVGILEIPRNCIAEVVVNPVAKDLLSGEMQFLATADWLAKTACCAIHPVATKHHILSARSWNRSIPVAYGRIPYNGILGSVVMEKGVNVAGRLLSVSPKEYDRYVEDAPHGYFGDRDAKNEIAISNELIRHGFRASLSPGYLVLKEKQYRKLLSTHDPISYGAYMSRSMDIVAGNGDEIAILYRVVGTKERYDNDHPHYESPAQQRGDMAFGARLMLEEAERGNSFMRDVFRIISSHAGTAQYQKSKECLRVIGSREPLPETARRDMMHVFAAMDAKNAKAITKANIACYFPVKPKDIDCAHIATDFELTSFANRFGTPFDAELFIGYIVGARMKYMNTLMRTKNTPREAIVFEKLANDYLGSVT